MEKSRKIVILNPVGEAEILKFNLAPRPNHIEGKTIGLLDNLKPNANVILDWAGRRLVHKLSSLKVIAKSKPVQAAPIPEAIIREFSEKCDLVINALSDWGSCTSWSVHDAIELEKRGLPTATFITQEFGTLGRLEAEALGMPSLPLIIIPHPMGNLSPDKVHEAIDKVIEELIEVLTLSPDNLEKKYTGKYSEGKKTYKAKPLFSLETKQEKIEVTDSLEAIYRLIDLRGWSDGLPVVPPTEERVSRMVEYTDRDPGELLGIVPPRRGKATIEKIAINAVMAGCLPKYFPVIIAAVQAVLEPKFNLYGIQATTNPVAPLLIMNGPMTKELDINSGYNVFGQGWRGNSTIGRAIRFILTNIGGGIPGTVDRSTQGQPGKYSFCIAENEEENPWEALHVERGFDAQTSTVTVVGAAGTLNVMDYVSTTAQGTLMTLAHSMAVGGTNNVSTGGEPLLVMCPEHAMRIAQGGFTKKDVKTFLYDNARIPLHQFTKETIASVIQKRRPKWYLDAGPHTMVTIADSADAIIIVVAGGAGPHSKYVPTFGGSTKSVTKAITFRDGQVARSVKDFKK